MPAVFGVAVSSLLASFGISLALEIAAIVVGCRGSIFERRPRRFLPYIIYADTASHVLQLAFTCEVFFLHDINPGGLIV